ncbi:Spy/CpxP family protein refolding chaperone [Janthinobacterium sp.]|uniref:Spy/CpxP family protein refolding chaperone n=1 Tax=Janthinobacterium sp. TaxID=1871054 RepID=UPI00293D2E4B|nr:Spy/CpxP family protein refolding chaperone [Janthinobacterium sp.]
MNTFRKTLLIAFAVAGLSTATLAVHAADAPRHDKMAMHEEDGAKMAERMAKHQAKLHEKLKLSAAQEPAWAAFTAAAMAKTPGAHMDHAAMATAMAKLTAPERLEQWIAMSKERLATQESRLAALKTFYAQLTPEQRKVFDANVPGGEHGGHGRHHMMR